MNITDQILFTLVLLILMLLPLNGMEFGPMRSSSRVGSFSASSARPFAPMAATRSAEGAISDAVPHTPSVDLDKMSVEKMRQQIRERLALVEEKDVEKGFIDRLTRWKKDAIAIAAMVAAGVGTVDVMHYEGALSGWTLQEMVGNAEGKAIEETTARHKFLPKFFAGFFAWELGATVWDMSQFAVETLAPSSILLVINGAVRSYARTFGRGGELVTDFQDLPADLGKTALLVL